MLLTAALCRHHKLFTFLFVQVTWADIKIFDVLGACANADGKLDFLRTFPALIGHYNRMFNLPRIHDWIKKRPVTLL